MRTRTKIAERKKVIIIGAGFAGIHLVRRLNEGLFDILLIDKLNHHQFQPLFYQVATSQIEPSSISFPLRNIFRYKRNVQIRMAEVISVNGNENEIITTIGNFDYDYLIIATGCRTNFFGNRDIERNSLSLKTTYDAISIRNHILLTYESFISAGNDEKESLLNLVIAGGGPTGVELAGAFAEIKRNILPEDYPGIDFNNLKIILVEGSNSLLRNMSVDAQTASMKYLADMGVTLLFETFVVNYDGHVAMLSNGQEIKTKTVIWVAGIIGNLIEGFPETAFTGNGRIRVNRINQVQGYEDVFAVGDIAMMETPRYPRGHPQLANVAITQARRLARNMKAKEMTKPLVEYEYRDWGSMATIGNKKAVVDLPFLKFRGFFAWLFWMFLHLMLILSVKNKLIIFINWAWKYMTEDTSLRLILIQTGNKNKHSK